MSELDDPALLAHADRLNLHARAADVSLAPRGVADAIAYLDRNLPVSPDAIYLKVADDILPLATGAAQLHANRIPDRRTDATVLDLRQVLSFDDHPAYVFTYLVAAQARLAGAKPVALTVDDAWLHTLTPAVVSAQNPAKQIALRFFNRVPLLWADEEWTAGIAGDWRLRILRYAESAALASTLSDMQQAWSMARFPNFWVQAIVTARLSRATAATNTSTLQSLLSKRRIQTIEIEAPGAAQVDSAIHLLYLGEWVALYLAALYGVDPADRVPLQLLDIA